MGCGGSKAKKKSDVAQVDEEEIEIAYKGGSEVKKRVHTIMALKTRLQRAVFEKCGVEAHIEESREKLTKLSEGLVKAKESYQFLLNYAMERDADELFRALTSSSSADKRVLIDVLTARTRWQLGLITEAYERKHHVPLLKIIKDNLRTSIGVFTGSNSDLGRLLLLVAMDQPERDSQLLQQHTSDFDKIIEIVTTRTNRELKGALDYYHHQQNKTFAEVIQSKAYQNFGKMMKVILECKRSESTEPLDPQAAKDIAMALGEAINKKNAEEVIRLLANTSFPQYKSINDAYMGMNKKKEITKALNVFSGDFYQLLVARCTEKYNYLCSRICEDKESIQRILGSLTRAECKKLRDTFDLYRAKYGNGYTLESVLRTEIKKESFLTACLNLISSDTSEFPLGNDRELEEDETLVQNVVKGVEQAAKEAYDADKMRELGEAEATKREIEVDMSKPKVTLGKGRSETQACIAELDEIVSDLKTLMRTTEEEVTHLAELSFAMAAHIRQAEEWTAMYETYANQLNSHIEKIDQAAAAGPVETNRLSLLAAPMNKILNLPGINKLKNPKFS